MKKTHLFLALTAFLLAACEQPFLGEPSVAEESANFILRVEGFEQTAFDDGVSAPSRTVQRITDVCSRLNFVVYDGEAKMRSVAQKRGDTGFGTASFSLPQGTYTFAVIGHSSESSATVTSLDKISFKDNRVTDTFVYCASLEVTAEQTVEEVVLSRCVALFRLVLTDETLPEQVAAMKFYYTGGSSTLSALTGYGSVNSKQTVRLSVASDQRQFEVYTIPKAETGALKMTITAMDAAENTLQERVFEEVPVQRNRVTTYTGRFFEGAVPETGETTLTGLKAETEWDGENVYTF